ncbi:T-cell-specific guanine nucleotide triphosphate-binding protein 2-like [Pseudophryne corroboree]|uniref:T-cell-specific guanine nucleotide triphosphate-binding protein 2-like n=1 Tax=Pseudophryne corroboree TaxID=495146 RepID=UPI003081C547
MLSAPVNVAIPILPLGATINRTIETCTSTLESESHESMYTDAIFGAFSEDELQDIIQALHESTLCDTSESKCSKDVENPIINIAVTGESGSGKSTLVNTICGLDEDEEGAAKTGVVETTKSIKAYPHSKHRNLMFWDLPGTGTLNSTASNYLQSVSCHQYDFFIILASERLRHNDIELAKEILSIGKKFFYVRNKIDSDLNASKVRRRRSYNEEKILKEIRDNCMKGLSDNGIGQPHVFLISCFDMEKYDYHLLEETLGKELLSKEKPQ